MKLGIIREGKIPPDSRVLFTPQQCVDIQKKYNVKFIVQPSEGRCIPDSAYADLGIEIDEDMNQCDILMGIKEVPKNQLIANKTYFFFSHTIKAQAYNRDLLKTILQKNIRLIDYEVLTNTSQQRVIAFGRFAGIVGAHTGMMTYARRTGLYELDQMHQYDDYAAAISAYQKIKFPKMKIVLTGTGRVANGAAEVLNHMNIQKVSPSDFLSKSYDSAVYTQLDCCDYAAPNDGSAFDLMHFFKHPNQYHSIFEPYTQVADLMINGIYWANEAPAFFTKEAMKRQDFNIKVIADVTCDIAPVASIPSTLYATTIAAPVFGYDPITESAVEPFQPHSIDMMTIDNLPNELPKDASKSFGEQFAAHVLEELLALKDTGMLERATIAEKGQLGKYFKYLEDFVA